jgi:hypothetical protein
MLQNLFRIKSYLNYFLLKKGSHKIHSPFVYDFYTKAVHNRSHFSEYDKLLKTMSATFSNTNVIETVDFGAAAGNKEFITYRTSIGEIAKKRTIPKKIPEASFQNCSIFQARKHA